MTSSPSHLESLFYAGEHRQVLLATLDSPTGDFAEDEVSLVIGALVFSGRTDEAAALFRSWSGSRDGASEKGAVIAAASRFFLCLAECRAGRYAAAERLCRATLGEAWYSRRELPCFYLHQGLGLVRHFAGRMSSAARHAARARRYAAAARFPYGRMLALDLLGHATLYRGRVLCGIALLEQAAELADAIGIPSFAVTTRSAVAVNRARFGVGELSAVDVLSIQHEAVGEGDRYSRRVLLTELAEAHALAGAATAAALALRRAEEHALPDGDRRVAVKWRLASALIAGLHAGEDAAGAILTEAHLLIEGDNHPALELEIAWYEYLVCPLAFARRTAADLSRLARATGISRGALLATARAGTGEVCPDEDRFAQLIYAARARKPGVLQEVLDSGRLGLVPVALGLTPGRRVHCDAVQRTLVLEDRGDIVRVEFPTDALLVLLRAIANGPKTKEDLIREVWLLNVYRPDRHDAVVHTAISRLRSALGPRPGWLVATPAGYSLDAGVELVESNRTNADLVARPSASNLETAPRHESALDARRDEALTLVRRPMGAATRDVAAALRVSEMTALRLLTSLVENGLIQRVGHGRNTRYLSLNDAPPAT